MSFFDWLKGGTLVPRPPSLPEVAAVQVWEDLSKLDQSTVMSGAITEAWQIWRSVGEIHYVTTQQARQTSRLDWKITIGGTELDHENAEAHLLAGYGNNLPDLVRKMALHLQVAGAFFFIRNEATRKWDVVTWPAGYAVKQQLARADVIIEITQEDPANPQLTDSPVLAVIPVARELILSRQQARVAARNRTAQLNTVIYPREGAGPDPKAFESKVTRVMTEPLADEMSAASVVPNLIGFQGDKIALWRTIDLTGPIDEKLHVRIEGLIRQLAVILDIPPEVMTGVGDVNHWGGWQIAEDNWLGHIEPMAKPIGQALALGLSRAADMDPDLIEIEPDPAPLLKRRPALSDVMAASAEGLVNAEWARRQLGAGEEDAPTQNDPVVTTVLEMIAQAPSLAASPGLGELAVQVRALLAGGEAPPPAVRDVGVDVVAVEEPTQPQAAAITRGPLYDKGVPEVGAPSVPFSTERLAGIDQQAFDATQDLLEVVGTRVVERLGSQIRSQLQGDPEAKAAIQDVPNAVLPVKLGVGTLPNSTQTMVETSTTALSDGLAKIIARAVGYTRSAGVEIELEQPTIQSATDLLTSEFGALMAAWLDGQPTDALMWRLSRRVICIAGGGADPAPQTAAPGVGDSETPLAGIALGVAALLYIRSIFGLEPEEYRWQHNTISNPHPVHDELNGVIYDGRTVPTASYTAYIGDHAGCVAGGTEVSGPPVQATTLRRFEGTVIELSTASGKKLTITPNHPVLTNRGWVPAGKLDKGDEVVCDLRTDRAPRLVPNDVDRPSLVEEVVDSFSVPVHTVKVSAEDFHGDGQDGDVHVKGADGALRNELDATGGKPIADIEFNGADVLGAVELLQQRIASTSDTGIGSAAFSGVSSRGISEPLFGGESGVSGVSHRAAIVRGDASVSEDSGDNATGDAVLVGELQDADPVVDVPVNDSRVIEVAEPGLAVAGTPDNSSGLKSAHDGLSADAVALADSLQSFTGFVGFDELISVERRDFADHVYNLETVDGWYSSNGIIVHNCRCAALPEWRDASETDVIGAPPEGITIT